MSSEFHGSPPSKHGWNIPFFDLCPRYKPPFGSGLLPSPPKKIIGRVSRSRSRSKAPCSNDWRRRPRDRWNRWNQWIKPSVHYFFLLSIHMKYNMFVNTRFVCTIKSINLHYECTINAYQMHCTILLVCMNLPCLHSFFCSTTITTSDLCFIGVLLMYSELV